MSIESNSVATHDAVIALAGGIDERGQLPPKVLNRMDTAIELVHSGAAPYLIVTGGWGFTVARPPKLEAEAMTEYALSRGIASDAIIPEDQSHDTIGNACFSKRNIAVPQGWTRLLLVTSESHIGRSERIFDHVFGDGYAIDSVAAPEQTGIKTKVWEYAASLLFDHVLMGTQRGDEEQIIERLEASVPGYGPTTNKQLVLQGMRNILHNPHVLSARL